MKKYIRLDDVESLLYEYGVSNLLVNKIRQLPGFEADEPAPKLLPCPICKSTNILCNSKSGPWGYEKSSAKVRCNSCGISISYEPLDSNDSAEDAEREAIRRWNDLKRK